MERVTVAEAAQRLGISKDAVRQRIRRHTIEYERDEDGSVYVLLSPETTPRDTVGDDVHNAVDNALVEELRDRVGYLEKQLDQEREANRENRRLLAAALERIPAIEAPQDTPSEPREPPVSGGEGGPGGTMPQEQERRSERSWWRKFFGFD